MRFIKTSLSLLLIAVLLTASLSVGAVAQPAAAGVEASSTVPYTTYMYNYNGDPITTPHAYIPSSVYSGSSIGIGDFVYLSDVEVGDDGSIYIIDKDYIPEGSLAGDIDAMAQSRLESVTNTDTTDTSADDTSTDAVTDESTDTSADSEEEDDLDVVIDESSLPEEMRSDIVIETPEQLVKYIDMLPDISQITIDYGRRVAVMYEAYDNFTDNDRVKVTNKDKLIEADNYISKEAAVVAKTGAQLDKYIAVLPADLSDITIEHESRIAALNAAYKALPAAEQANVTGVYDLEDASERMYYSESLDARTAEILDRFIDLLPPTQSITEAYEDRIQALLIAYRKLTAEEKILVTKKEVLDAAEYKLDEYQSADRYKMRKGRLVVLNKDYTVKFIINDFSNDGHFDGFCAPEGVTISPDGHIYIADTENGRVLEFDENGSFVRDVKDPQVSQLGDDYVYRPSKVAVDNSGNIYVVAKNANMGVLLLDENGDFTGFVGAQKVVYSPIDYIWKTILSEEQQARMESFVPTEYNNIKMDSDGFAYVTTSAIASDALNTAIMSGSTDTGSAPVKRLNPSGKDVLQRWGYFMPCGDVSYYMDSTGNYTTSVITDVAVHESGRYTILDTRYNRLFTYSKTGELLYAFGGSGHEAGNTSLPTAIAYDGNDLLIVDCNTGFITRYTETEYGHLIDEAYYYYYQYEYDKSVEMWKLVLQENANFDIAYDGIANAFIRTEDYDQAMEYYRYSNNKTGYSNAFNKQRTYIIENYLLVVLAVIVVILFAIVKFFKYIGRRNRAEKYIDKRGTLWSQICYAFYVMIHPFDGFWDIKFEKRGSMKAANIIILLSIGVNVAAKFFMNYLFNTNYGYKINVLFEIAMVLVPLLLWVVSNWSVTTLMDGEGKMKDVYIFTAYSLMPTVIISILGIVISHFMTLDEAMYLTFFDSLSTFWFCFLVFCANTTIHRYTVAKSVGSIIISIVGIAIILFVILVIISTYSSMVSFIVNVVKEIAYRL